MREEKIFDLKPPALRGDFSFAVKQKIKEKSGKSAPIGPSRFPWILVLFLFIFAGIAGAYYFTEPRLEIKITPKNFLFEKTIDVKSAASKYDFANLDFYVPLSKIIQQDPYSREFDSSEATVSEKAKGIVRIFNETQNAQNFVANTQLIQGDGRVFLTTNKIIVPGQSAQAGKVAPGYVDAQVVASSAGADYNIGPSNFSFPKLKKTELYTKFYGKSYEPMKGGYSGTARVASQEDLSRGLETTEKEALAFAAEKFQQQYKGDIIFSDSIARDIATSSAQVSAGEKSDKFSCTAIVRTRALLLKKNDLEEFARAFVSSSAPADNVVNWKTFEYSIVSSSADIDKERAFLKIRVSAQSFAKMEKDKIAQALAGKYISEISEILQGFYPEKITSLNLSVWPWGKPKAPRIPSRIRIEFSGID